MDFVLVRLCKIHHRVRLVSLSLPKQSYQKGKAVSVSSWRLYPNMEDTQSNAQHSHLSVQ
jgi:hypothetical protein